MSTASPSTLRPTRPRPNARAARAVRARGSRPARLVLLLVVVVGPVVVTRLRAARVAHCRSRPRSSSTTPSTSGRTAARSRSTSRSTAGTAAVRQGAGPTDPRGARVPRRPGSRRGAGDAGCASTATSALWWVTFWSATLPCGRAARAPVRRRARRSPGRSVALAVTLLPRASARCCCRTPRTCSVTTSPRSSAFGAWIVARTRSRSNPAASRSPVCSPARRCSCEYETAIIVPRCSPATCSIRNRRRIVQFAARRVRRCSRWPWYQWRAFGAPWRTPAAFYAPAERLLRRRRCTTCGGCSAALGGLWVGRAAGDRRDRFGRAGSRARATAGCARTRSSCSRSSMPYIVLCAGWSGTPLLEDPGPRYLIPALPFLAVPLAVHVGPLCASSAVPAVDRAACSSRLGHVDGAARVEAHETAQRGPVHVAAPTCSHRRCGPWVWAVSACSCTRRQWPEPSCSSSASWHRQRRSRQAETGRTDVRYRPSASR